MINILIVEDQTLMLDALASLLSLDASIRVVGKASNGQLALNILKNTPVDIVLTDIEMPEMSGLELAEHIQAHYPSICTVIMTTFSKSGYVKRAINMGVKAFILKETPSDTLIATLKGVKNGKRIIDPELALMAMEDNDPLTSKERLALKLAGEGVKAAHIAQKLCLSEGTVRNYLSDAIAKLHASNRIEAARIAKQKGWI